MDLSVRPAKHIYLRRPCRRCEGMFKPHGKHNRFCDECKAEMIKERVERTNGKIYK